MPRPPRIQYENAIYHIIARGNRTQDIFLDDADRERFLSCLKEARTKFDLEIFCFALLDNHFHISLRTRRANLSKAMQWLQTSYSVYFNLRHKATGHLFAGRYKSILVESERYLIALSCYVHLNPVKAGLVKDPRSCRWSSCRAYTGSKANLAWLSTDVLLGLFGGQGEKRRRTYHHALAERADAARRMDKLISRDFIIGGSEFRTKICKRFGIEERMTKPYKPGLDPEQIIKTVAGYFRCSIETVLRNKKGEANLYRDTAIYLIRKYTYLKRKEISALFGISDVGVAKSLERISARITTVQKFSKEIAGLEKQLYIWGLTPNVYFLSSRGRYPPISCDV